jgi:hypothetical protein
MWLPSTNGMLNMHKHCRAIFAAQPSKLLQRLDIT